MQELSQETKTTLEQLLKVVRKVMACCVLYLVQRVPQQRPDVLSLDNATPAGQLAVADRYKKLLRYVLSHFFL